MGTTAIANHSLYALALPNAHDPHIFQSFGPVSQKFLNRTASMARTNSLVMNSITNS